MLGIAQGATKSHVRKMRKALKREDGVLLTMDEALDFGSRAVYAHLETLWPANAGDAPTTPNTEVLDTSVGTE